VNLVAFRGGNGAVDATRAFMISVSRPASAVEDWTPLFDHFGVVQSCRNWLSVTGMGAPTANIGISRNALFFEWSILAQPRTSTLN